MYRFLKFFLLTLLVGISFSAFAQSSVSVDSQAVARLLSTYQGSGTTELPVIHKNDRGFVRFLLAPEGGYFSTPMTGQKSFDAPEMIKDYIQKYIKAFAIESNKTEFNVESIIERDDYQVIRLTQKYSSLPVFGSGVIAQLTNDGKILALACEIMRDDTGLKSLDISQPFPIDETAATDFAIQFILKQDSTVNKQNIETIGNPYIAIYDPNMLKISESPCIVYVISLAVKNTDKRYRILVDSFTGEVRLNYLLYNEVINREIYDANNSYTITETPNRKEGDRETGIVDIDNAYDYLGDAYNFFATNHGRDSYDNKGATLMAIVRLPIQNAYWDTSTKAFWLGTGFAVDDVIGHEYTHSVTDDITGLVYFGEPGAISESLSDIWGEFIDLTNGKGLDTGAVRWQIGEDLPSGTSWEGGSAIRNMKDPTIYNLPDRYNSPLFVKTSSLSVADNAGVHTNCGVGDKLAYLLTDGDSFNGEKVNGFGIVRTAKLFYGALELLPPVADYAMLSLALNASALQQGLSIEDRFNLSRAMRAVEILPEEMEEMGARDFRATSILVEDDMPAILLSWTPPAEVDYSQVVLVRKAGSYPQSTLDGDQIFVGKGSYFLDVNVSSGIEYFYSLLVDMVEFPPIEMYDSAIAGGYAPSVLTQEFTSIDPRQPIANEIIYSQIYFIPTGPPVNPLGENKYLGGYYNYEAVFTPEVFSFPVKRQDATGSAYSIPLSTDGLVSFDLTDVQFPFFGKKYGTIYLGANGYISFIPVGLENAKNFPSLASHFAIPRISFLFSDLAPDSAGEVWTRKLDDRFVITFENVPKNAEGEIPNPLSGANPGSSVQVELFFSGHIRITYLQLDPNYCIVGLSDGRGVPLDPAQLYPGEFPYSLQRYTDFPQLPETPTQLSFEPSPLYTVLPEQNITFEVVTLFPGSTVPQLSASWLREDTPPFADLKNGKGKFSWRPTQSDDGTYYLRVLARLGEQYAYQDIPIIVNPVIVQPQATNLRISSQSPAEDTTASRIVSAGRPLVASYDYIHPLMVENPTQYAEGLSILYWFRNHEVVPVLTNYKSVPPNVTKGGDIWYFRVIPISLGGIIGEEAISPVIYIVGQPEITSVYPNRGKSTGGEPIRIRGRFFVGILNIKLAGIPVPSYRAISETEIEVTTPQCLPGMADIYLQTTGGFSQLSQAFEFYEEPQPPTEPEPEKRRCIISCGNNPSNNHHLLGDGIILSLLLVYLAFRKEKSNSIS